MIPPFEFTDISDSERIDWIRELLFEYAEKPAQQQYLLDQILRLTCDTEEHYNDAIEAGFENDWSEGK